MCAVLTCACVRTGFSLAPTYGYGGSERVEFVEQYIVLVSKSLCAHVPLQKWYVIRYTKPMIGHCVNHFTARQLESFFNS